jgi:hypothetical protein
VLANIGTRIVTMTTGSEVETFVDGYTVIALLSVSPSAGRQGQQNLLVALSDGSTNWVRGTTSASLRARDQCRLSDGQFAPERPSGTEH